VYYGVQRLVGADPLGVDGLDVLGHDFVFFGHQVAHPQVELRLLNGDHAVRPQVSEPDAVEVQTLVTQVRGEVDCAVKLLFGRHHHLHVHIRSRIFSTDEVS